MRKRKTHPATEPPNTRKSRSKKSILGFALAGAAGFCFDFGSLEGGAEVEGAVGGGKGTPEDGPSDAPGTGIGGLLPPKGGRPVGATEGIPGEVGLVPRVGAPTGAGTMPGFAALNLGAMPDWVAPLGAGESEGTEGELQEQVKGLRGSDCWDRAWCRQCCRGRRSRRPPGFGAPGGGGGVIAAAGAGAGGAGEGALGGGGVA